jgi:hypothetical protein
MKTLLCSLFMTGTGIAVAWAQSAGGMRTWTSTDGKKIEATMLGVKGDGVEIRMANGSTFVVPLARLSAEDQAFVTAAGTAPKGEAAAAIGGPAAVVAAAANPAAAKEWPRTVALAEKPEVIVVREDAEKKEFVYRSPHYEFQCDSKLGANVVREFGRMFEATYQLNCLLPLDWKPKPEPLREFFLARLFTNKDDYFAAGGVQGSAGIYNTGVKALMVPLSSLGVKMVGSRVSLENNSEDDNGTLIHEITHQMMNHWLRPLPTWLIEGSAEYVEMLEYNSNGRFSLMGMERQLKKYVNRMYWDGDGKRYVMLDLEELMGLDGRRWAAALGKDGNATQNYGSAGLLTYYFYHLDGEGDAKHMIAYLRALQEVKTREQGAPLLKQHLMRERTHQQLAEDVKKAFRKEGVDITFDAAGKNAAATGG